jgi:hypothetical protein
LHGPREEGGYARSVGFGGPGGSRGPGAPSRLPQAVGDALAPSEPAEPEPVDDLPDAGGYRTGRIMAAMIAVMGWTALLGGVLVFVLAFTIAPASLSAPVLGLPLGLLAGIALFVGGIVLVLAGQLAHAVFDNASAVRHLLAIEKAKALS